jgi:gliding motility-associated-like protein
MSTKTQFFLSFLFIMFCSIVSAQDQIERVFRSDRQNSGIDIAQTSDEGYLVLSGGRPLDSLRFEYLTVTKFDNKSNLLWSKDYSFEHKVFPDGSITVLEGDSFVISGVLDTTSLNKVLMKAAPGGDVTWTRGFGRDDINIPLLLGDASVDNSYRNGFFIAGDVYNAGFSTDIYLAEADQTGTQLWAKSYSGTNSGYATSKVHITQDSGAILCGTVIDFPTSNIFVIKTDTIGNIEWSREYGESTLAEIGTTITPTPDGGYLIGGRKINPILPSHPGVLIKTDTFGVPQWTRNVDFQTSDSILINDIIIDTDGDAIVSGSLLGDNDNFAFMAKVNMNGDIIWKRRYKAATRQFPFSNGLMESSLGGYVYLTSSDDEMDGMQIGPYLIKTDEDGTTICDSIVNGQLLYPTMVTIDTLIFTSSDITDTKEITVVDTLNYNGFIIVNLELDAFGPYCPDEVFSDTLDATVDGAVAYEWSTGETTPTLVVTEFGEYKVTVTIGVDYCYQLCAESKIDPKPLPMVELSINDDSYCTTGIVTVNANVSAVDDYEWSTGESSNSIMVDTEGMYSVTVTNECDSAVAEIMVVFDTSPPEVTISSDGTFCATGSENLTATYSFGDALLWSTGDDTDVTTVTADDIYFVTVSSNFCEDGVASYDVETPDITVIINDDGSFCSNGSVLLTTQTSSPANSYIWSTGETTEEITATSLGTFSVTVSDFCDDGSFEFNVEPIQISVTIDQDSSYCTDGDEVLAAIPSGAASTYSWSTGDNTQSITATNEGEFSVTVTDFCGEASATTSILCPIFYDISNAFTPNNDEISDLFIPVFDFDPNQLVEYEFIIYSRWGKKVFETTDPFEGWDGLLNEKPALPDAYMYTVKGVNNLGVQLTHKKGEKNHGDLTLIR